MESVSAASEPLAILHDALENLTSEQLTLKSSAPTKYYYDNCDLCKVLKRVRGGDPGVVWNKDIIPGSHIFTCSRKHTFCVVPNSKHIPNECRLCRMEDEFESKGMYINIHPGTTTFNVYYNDNTILRAYCSSCDMEFIFNGKLLRKMLKNLESSRSSREDHSILTCKGSHWWGERYQSVVRTIRCFETFSGKMAGDRIPELLGNQLTCYNREVGYGVIHEYMIPQLDIEKCIDICANLNPPLPVIVLSASFHNKENIIKMYLEALAKKRLFSGMIPSTINIINNEMTQQKLANKMFKPYEVPFVAVELDPVTKKPLVSPPSPHTIKI
jgi:hypothetical protein